MKFEIIDTPKRATEPKYSDLIGALKTLTEGKSIRVPLAAGSGKRPAVSPITAIQGEARDAGFTARVLSVTPDAEDATLVQVVFTKADLRASKGEEGTEETKGSEQPEQPSGKAEAKSGQPVSKPAVPKP